MKIVILDSDTFGGDISLELFHSLGELSIYQTTSKEQTIDRIKEAEVIITNKVILNQEVLEHAPHLKLICIAATGTNNVELPYTKSKGIVVTNVAGYSTKSVVQHTFAMLLYLMESLAYYDGYVKSGEYTKSPIFTHLNRPYQEINGKKWGIIGFGAIGKEVAKVAEAFGAEVMYYFTSGQNSNQEYTRVELDNLLTECDIISIHAPLTPNTLGLIGEDELRKMKPTAFLLNLGRGGIVVEEALVRILEEDGIAGAALDVLDKEPMIENHHSLGMKNHHKLLITPHIAWASKEARVTLMSEIKANIEAIYQGEVRNVVS